MEQEIIQTLPIVSFAPAAFLLVWKVLIPLTNLFIAKMSGTDVSANERLKKIENNDLSHIESRIDELSRGISESRFECQRQNALLGERLAVVETKLIK